MVIRTFLSAAVDRLDRRSGYHTAGPVADDTGDCACR